MLDGSIEDKIRRLTVSELSGEIEMEIRGEIHYVLDYGVWYIVSLLDGTYQRSTEAASFDAISLYYWDIK